MKNILAASSLSLLAFGASAELIATDYLVDGDAKATLDTETGIEWLDLSETYGVAYSNIEQELLTNFVGWRLPTIDELNDLFTNTFSGINIGAGSQSLNSSETSLYVNMFGDRGDGYAVGFAMNESGTLKLWQVNKSGLTWNNYHSYNQYLNGHSGVGIFLVSDGGLTISSIENPELNIANPNSPVNNGSASVPLTSAASLLILGLAGLSRRKRQS